MKFITPLEYLHSVRLEKAKNILSETNIPIIEISYYVGINGREYFTYFFKKHTGLTPKQYREKFKKARDNSSKE